MSINRPLSPRTLLLAWACGLLLAGCSRPAPLELVTPEEASQPASRSSPVKQTDGPLIELRQPRLDGPLVNPFPIEVHFRSTGEPVNMSSLKLTYMKLWGIDITDRLRGYIRDTRIEVPDAKLPPGRHTLEIYIEDIQGNISRHVFSAKVTNPD